MSPPVGGPPESLSGSLAEARAEGGRILDRLRRNRAKLEIVAIGAIALGGIVCMVLATLVIVWRLNNG